MYIDWVKLAGFRNFEKAQINFKEKTLIIGANDVGKTNLLYSLRILLDRTIPETMLEPLESDFHINSKGECSDSLMITIKLSDIKEDAVLSILKGAVSEDNETYLRYSASFKDFSYEILSGFDPDEMTELPSRSYLRHIHFRYIQSIRDLNNFIKTEKRHLIRISKDDREKKDITSDQSSEHVIKESLIEVDEAINALSYVKSATDSINIELNKLSYHNSQYKVNLKSGSINLDSFISNLKLAAETSNKTVGLGGDGRNNQILLALWKAKSEREHDFESSAIIYCIEEPEAHLHPHQQRKLSNYLVEELIGNVLVSTHSPQIAQSFAPDKIVRLFEKDSVSQAANNGCSDCIQSAWNNMGYRMSIIPSEGLFSDSIFLVEGPSEVQFYQELARQLEIDLDFFNISIIPVNGIDFKVFIAILDAMEIPWVMRTDNDVFKVPRSSPTKWQLSGINRCFRIIGKSELKKRDKYIHPIALSRWMESKEDWFSPKGIYLSKVDLEHDLVDALPAETISFSNAKNKKGAIKYFQKKKAVRMSEFILENKDALKTLSKSALVAPLLHSVKITKERIKNSSTENSEL